MSWLTPPFVTEPGYTQNFNRYAYVYNNPLTYIDPSGFETLCFEPSVAFSYGSTISNSTPSDPNHVVVDGTRDKEVCVNIPDLPNIPHVGQPGNSGGSGGGGSGSGGGGSFDPSSIPVPTLVPIDIYSSCDALADRMGEIQERREDLNALRDALQKADVGADAMEAILKGAQNLPLDVKLVGVSSPSTWVWLHPSAGYGQLLMPSHANGAFNAAIRTGAAGAVRYMPLVSFGIDGAQVYSAYLDGDEMGMVYNTIDAVGTLALSRNVYGIVAAATLKSMGGSKMIHENSRVVAAAQACEAESGVYVPY